MINRRAIIPLCSDPFFKNYKCHYIVKFLKFLKFQKGICKLKIKDATGALTF
jgi:hypothetical protein